MWNGLVRGQGSSQWPYGVLKDKLEYRKGFLVGAILGWAKKMRFRLFIVIF